MVREDFIIDYQGSPSCKSFSDCGWYIALKANSNSDFLWKDLEVHDGTGYLTGPDWEWGGAPGYYPTRENAEIYLEIYLIVQSKLGAAKLEAEKLAAAEEAEQSKPEYSGVYTCRFGDTVDRVIFRVTDKICQRKGSVVVLNPHGSVCNCDNGFENVLELGYDGVKKLGD